MATNPLAEAGGATTIGVARPVSGAPGADRNSRRSSNDVADDLAGAAAHPAVEHRAVHRTEVDGCPHLSVGVQGGQ